MISQKPFLKKVLFRHKYFTKPVLIFTSIALIFLSVYIVGKRNGKNAEITQKGKEYVNVSVSPSLVNTTPSASSKFVSITPKPNSSSNSVNDPTVVPTTIAPEPTSISSQMSQNLLVNSWFKSGFLGWVDATGPEGHWSISEKAGNPSPDGSIGTSARISTGRGDDETGATVPINYDAYLYQIVSADSSKSYLEFDMYWVTHTMNPGEVTIYGGASSTGPWIEVWKPFHKVVLTVLKPPPGTVGGHNKYLWDYYSATTSMVGKDIGAGYPYYKLELHGKLPDESGGFKVTGIHFGVK